MILTKDQEAAKEAFYAFLDDPVETVFVLAGYSGTGKTTLVKNLIDGWDGYRKLSKIVDPDDNSMQIKLTATTNKAAENFAFITGKECPTIHSFLGLRVVKNYETNQTYLKQKHNHYVEPCILLIDEASYIDSDLFGLIFKHTKGCKVVFIGDPAQLTAVRSNTAPVFNAGFNGAKLTEVVRAAEDSPITNLATKFRNTVNTGEFFSFKPDGVVVQHLSRENFDQAVLDEFTRKGWKHSDSKFLAWTNKTVIDYNNAIHDKVSGSPDFKVGDYAVCNSFVKLTTTSIKTDQLVCITGIDIPVERYGITGRFFELDHIHMVFVPDSIVEKKELIKKLRKTGSLTELIEVEERWPDLRAAYAQTINKSQGSTYKSVYIDLDDIGKCNNANTLARMLYVGVSRAQERVYLTGDLA